LTPLEWAFDDGNGDPEIMRELLKYKHPKIVRERLKRKGNENMASVFADYGTVVKINSLMRKLTLIFKQRKMLRSINSSKPTRSTTFLKKTQRMKKTETFTMSISLEGEI